MITLSKSVEPKLRDIPKRTILILQGEIAVSKNGFTSIYSPGYAGCLALIIASRNGPGAGLVAHIAETGHKPPAPRKTYILQSVDLVLGLAVTHLTSPPFDVALFRGWPDETGWDFGLKNGGRVEDILDLRAVSHLNGHDCFRFDPAKRKVYLPGGRAEDSMIDERDNTIERSSLTVPLGNKPMPIFVYS
jgi:hypothetical protein